MIRHYVVVGGTRGLGKVFADRAAGAGDVVSILGRSAPNAPSAGSFTCDLQSPEDAAAVLEEVRRQRGELDGLAFFQRFRGPGDDWGDELQTSLNAAKTLIERSVPLFKPDGLKSIVLTSSVNAAFISPKLPVGYHVAKAGLCQLARYYACKLGEFGIRVNVVCPGTFVKPENKAYYQSHPEVAARLAKVAPLNRMGTADEVVDVLEFLLSEKSSFLTGQALTVDGGVSLQWHEHLGS